MREERREERREAREGERGERGVRAEGWGEARNGARAYRCVTTAADSYASHIFATAASFAPPFKWGVSAQAAANKCTPCSEVVRACGGAAGSGVERATRARPVGVTVWLGSRVVGVKEAAAIAAERSRTRGLIIPAAVSSKCKKCTPE